MKKPAAAAVTAIFFFVAPGMVAGFIPWWISRWHMQPAPWDPSPLRYAGVALLLAGLAGLIESFARFVIHGRGTPAPPFPTETLVATGLYRHVRNPMYVAVLWIVSAQALFFANLWLFVYAAIAWFATHLFVVLYEEPTLRRTYGSHYEDYRARVPRWIPRLTSAPPARVSSHASGP